MFVDEAKIWVRQATAVMDASVSDAKNMNRKADLTEATAAEAAVFILWLLTMSIRCWISRADINGRQKTASREWEQIVTAATVKI